jgi:hypothetical protein
VIGKQWQNGSYFSAAWSTAGSTGGRPQELILLEQQMRMILLKTNNSFENAGNGLGVTASAYLHIKEEPHRRTAPLKSDGPLYLLVV